MSDSAVVFGASGQLGAELVHAFSRRGFAVHALTRAEADLTDAAAVEAAVQTLRPALVLNAAAYNLVDQAESEPLEALRGNALAVQHLAKAAARAGAKLVHFSTDYVFDGLAGRPLHEADTPHPVSAYGASKLAGEHFAQAYAEDVLVIRTAAVFGPAGAQTKRGNFVETMLRLAARQKVLRVVDDQTTSPAYTVALAERTAALVEAGVRGVVHAGGGEPLTWCAFARLIFQAAGVPVELEPIPTSGYPTPARRPPYSALDNARLRAAGLPAMPTAAEALAEYFRARS